MFWGRSLKQGEVLNISETRELGSVLHISHISLSPDSSSLKPTTTVTLDNQGTQLSFAVMQKDTNDFQDVNLTLLTNSDLSFTVTGPGEVNFLGYFEVIDSLPLSESSEEAESSEEEISFEPRSHRN